MTDITTGGAGGGCGCALLFGSVLLPLLIILVLGIVGPAVGNVFGNVAAGF